jgi:hypothetical protein
VRDQIESRFHVIKLDGPAKEDRRIYCDPVTWTHDEYVQTLQDTFYDSCELMNGKTILKYRNVKEVLHRCYQIHEMRMGTAVTDLENFEMDLTEGMHEEDAKTVSYAMNGLHCAKDLLSYWADDKMKVQLHGYKQRMKRKRDAEGVGVGAGPLILSHTPDSEETVVKTSSALDILMETARASTATKTGRGPLDTIPPTSIGVTARAPEQIEGQVLSDKVQDFLFDQGHDKAITSDEDFDDAYADEMEAMKELGL